jgi:DNA mismatch repair protein MutS
LPARVIERAREILAIHESTEQTATAELAPRPARQAPMQIRLFEPVNHDLAARIRSLNLDELRPIEALKLLAELQKELEC